jgi:hypothetical protein
MLNCIHITGFIVVRISLIFALYVAFIGRPMYTYVNRNNHMAVYESLANILNDILMLSKACILMQTDRVQGLVASVRDTFRYKTSEDDYSRQLLVKTGKISNVIAVALPLAVPVLWSFNMTPNEQILNTRKPAYDK